MSNAADQGIADLARLLGAAPPASLHHLDASAITRLAEAVVAETHRQAATLSQAVDHALRLVPRPLRGIVRRLIAG